jgi:hypothetical protein
MKTTATFTVKLSFDTKSTLSKEDFICTMNKIADALRNECDSGNGLATDVGNNEGYTTEIDITGVDDYSVGTRIKL